MDEIERLKKENEILESLAFHYYYDQALKIGAHGERALDYARNQIARLLKSVRPGFPRLP